MVNARFARSFLFVPGDRPDRFAKAIASGADSVIVDLEDAVGPTSKDVALQNALGLLSTGVDVVVRINAAHTDSHSKEIASLDDCVVMVPKAESAETLSSICERVGAAARVVALVETPRGIRDIDEIVEVPGVIRVALGNVDLGADLGVDPGSHRALAYARSRVVLACAAAGLPAPIDGVTTAVHSDVDLSRDLARCQELGFGAKLCIHPNQVGPTNRCFTPTASQIEWARQVMASAGTGVRLVNGAMVDEPVLRRAGRIVEVTSRLEGALG